MKQSTSFSTSDSRQVMNDKSILTINDVATILRCSKTHVSHVLVGKIPGMTRLTHIAMGGRKIVRRDWEAGILHRRQFRQQNR